MPYGIIKVDTVTFTDNGVDKDISLSGLVQNPTFTGNVTATGTISGDIIRGGTTISGATVTGTTANFTSGVFTTQLSGVTITGTTVATTTGTFTSLTGTTATFTSGIIASGTAALPSLAILSDPNTGIYSPGADQLAVATNGIGRLFVDASGNIGVGSTASSTAARLLDVNGGALQPTFQLRASSATVATTAYTLDTVNSLVSFISSDWPIRYFINGNERLRITSAGLVGIGTSSPGYALDCRGAVVAGNGTIQTALSFSTRSEIGSISNHSLGFLINSTTQMLLDTSGRLGIGTASPLSPLVVSNGSNKNIEFQPGASSALFAYDRSASDYLNLDIGGKVLTFNTNNGTERARIDSSGRLLVGTSSSSTGLEGQYAKLQVIGNSSGGGGGSYFTLARDEAATGITADEMIARITFGNTGPAEFAYISCQADAAASAGDYPGRLVFSTTADGASSPTERMRISSAGRFQVTGPYDNNITAVAALDMDLSTSNYFTKTINANSTFTVSNTPSSRAFSFTLELTHTSGTITWFSGVEWPGGIAPSLTTGKTHLFMFITDDGGTRWRASSLTNYTT